MIKSNFQKRLEELKNERNNQKTDKMDKKENIFTIIFPLVFIAVMITGEVRCIYKAYKCNWEPIGKAEIIYTGAALTGFGSIIGYFNIEDK